MKDLDDDLSVAILQKMDESQAAKTLAAMDADQLLPPPDSPGAQHRRHSPSSSCSAPVRHS